ncbi:membrane fusion protein, multidrug efflux system [Luteibacter sp. UNCMF331Sha3.1]|uniref:efflux RND transporter periplasmic adaptor subunit n=1 Tax=Luteibacter sp. UNCMF331Sha3.1 TaxID=1502760 RepID=UPI0008BF3933|nr:efflux RND transporter periplasmic adaptor subunit [Luteibacter sp. UNCMF331Sha3.1]SEM51852.1 membrane fusion protein, multidrug efflux system [Luteibacter sp. UNCMF331Sha3.1]
MTPNDDETREPREGAETPQPYKYRYKYLHKYGDAPAGSARDDDGDDGKHDDPRDDAKEKNKETEEKQDDKDEKDDPKAKRRKVIVLSVIAAVFLLAGLAWLLLYLFVFSQRETTDDAYVKGDMVTISSRVAGTVVEVAVEETDRVHAGQVLIKLDPVDAGVTLMNAEGQLAQAVREAQARMQQANQADAAIPQRRAQYEQARDEYNRRHPLLERRAVSAEEVDTGRRQMQQALAALQAAQREAAAAHAQVDGTTVEDYPAVVQARAQFRNAWVNSGRNAIVSPIEGYAARRQVQVGQRVQPGQDLLTVVPLSDLWVDANFKETQLEHIRIGQPVTISTDMYSDVEYHGKVAGLNAGTGSAFSLLPAENATGNWIKVVQRLPVRIAIDAEDLRRHPLRVGLSTDVNIDTHDRDGKVLAETPRTKPLSVTNVYEKEMARADERALEIIRANTVDDTPAPVPARRGS